MNRLKYRHTIPVAVVGVTLGIWTGAPSQATTESTPPAAQHVSWVLAPGSRPVAGQAFLGGEQTLLSAFVNGTCEPITVDLQVDAYRADADVSKLGTTLASGEDKGYLINAQPADQWWFEQAVIEPTGDCTPEPDVTPEPTPEPTPTPDAPATLPEVIERETELAAAEGPNALAHVKEMRALNPTHPSMIPTVEAG